MSLLQLVGEFGENATVTWGEVFDFLRRETEDPLSDGIEVTVDRVWLNMTSWEFVIQNVTIQTDTEVFYHADEVTISVQRAADWLVDVLPDGTVVYNYNVTSSASVLHNASSPHAVGAFNQAFMEYLFKQCSASPTTARLASVNHPLPLTDQQSIEIKTILSVLASLFLLIPYCYIPAAFTVFLVKERVSKSKHLQLVSGVNMSAYWFAAYLWDLTLFLCLTLLIMAVFLIYGNESAAVFVGDAESFLCTMMLTFGYGLSALPFSYLLSRMFKNHSSAQIAVMGIVFITGFVAVNSYFIMSSIESTQSIAEGLRPYYRTWPAYNVGEGFIQLSSAYWER